MDLDERVALVRDWRVTLRPPRIEVMCHLAEQVLSELRDAGKLFRFKKVPRLWWEKLLGDHEFYVRYPSSESLDFGKSGLDFRAFEGSIKITVSNCSLS